MHISTSSGAKVGNFILNVQCSLKCFCFFIWSILKYGVCHNIWVVNVGVWIMLPEHNRAEMIINILLWFYQSCWHTASNHPIRQNILDRHHDGIRTRLSFICIKSVILWHLYYIFSYDIKLMPFCLHHNYVTLNYDIIIPCISDPFCNQFHMY